MAYTLKTILAPLGVEEFLSEYWTRKFVHIPGPAQKFSEIYSWDVLNRALEQHRFDPQRLVLVKSGKKLDPGRYLISDRVHAAKLANELSAGATLIFNQCEEVYPPLENLSIELQKLFHFRVCVNLYAGWRRDNGFDVHWDKQDTIILQVAGRKHWKIWGPTRLYPFRDDVVDTSPRTRPTTNPVWDGVLEQGSLLSIPRGWWHVAYPLEHPCLHLTVTIKNLNGIDMLSWLAEQMKASLVARMELPICATRAEQAEWIREVRQALLAEFGDDFMERYVAHVDANTVPRTRISLPQDAEPGGLKVERSTPLQLATSHQLTFRIEDDSAFFEVNRAKWKTDVETAEKLRIFNDFAIHSISEIAPASDFRLAVLVGALIMSGVLKKV